MQGISAVLRNLSSRIKRIFQRSTKDQLKYVPIKEISKKIAGDTLTSGLSKKQSTTYFTTKGTSTTYTLPANTMATTIGNLTGAVSLPVNTISAVTSQYVTNVAAGQMLTSNGISAQWVNPNNATFTSNITGGGATLTMGASQYVMVIHGKNGKELVKVENDGSVIWQEGADTGEAAEMFSKCISLGIEKSAGITYGVKQRIRDTVFDELIAMANAKGSITADDLTYLHQAAKIMDKLKGIKD